jgi:hypothetical protein
MSQVLLLLSCLHGWGDGKHGKPYSADCDISQLSGICRIQIHIIFSEANFLSNVY